ncbi:MAG: hypothetical protein JW801_15965 [Bacteroidales bacterium]|nr:hypothetical protein [Bacteroidales bacterium]
MKPSILILSLFISVHSAFSQDTVSKFDRLQADFELYQFRTCIQEINYLTKSWVQIDRAPDACYKQKLIHILDVELPQHWHNLRALEKEGLITGVKELMHLTDSLLEPVGNIMRDLNEFADYDDPLIMYEFERTTIPGGEIDQYTAPVLTSVDKQIAHKQLFMVGGGEPEYFSARDIMEKEDEKATRLLADIELYMLLCRVRELEYLVRTIVFVDRGPDTENRKRLVGIINTEEASILSGLRYEPIIGEIKNLPAIEGHLDTLSQLENFILEQLASEAAYESPFVYFEVSSMVEQGGEIIQRSQLLQRLIEVEINSKAVAFPDPPKPTSKKKPVGQKKQKTKNEKVNKSELVHECVIYLRKKDDCLVCVPVGDEAALVADVDEITNLRLYRKDTLIENIEESYWVTYSKKLGVISISYAYGDYPEGMYSTHATYTLENGQLSSYEYQNTTTNWWVEPDSCCPVRIEAASYYFENGEFTEGEESFSDSEDESADYDETLEAIDDRKLRQLLETVDRIKNAEFYR